MREALEVVRLRSAERQAAQELAGQLDAKQANLAKLSGRTASTARVELGDEDEVLEEVLFRADQVSARLSQTSNKLAELEAELEEAQKFKRTILLIASGAAIVLVLILKAMMN